jgi:Polyketide cyclase / dehydrase and lipid transport
MKALIGVLVLAVLGAAAFVLQQPDRIHIERSAVIAAPSDTIFAHINDYHRWTAWSPWENLDPNMQRTYEGPTAGTGAAYRWEGNNEVGRGSMKITESIAPAKVVMALEFVKPFQASNTGTFTLTPEGAGTRVTWAMDGANTLIGKVMSLFMSMDAMVGSQFAEGLANLKRVSEASSRSYPAAGRPGTRDTEDRPPPP